MSYVIHGWNSGPRTSRGSHRIRLGGAREVPHEDLDASDAIIIE